MSDPTTHGISLRHCRLSGPWPIAMHSSTTVWVMSPEH